MLIDTNDLGIPVTQGTTLDEALWTQFLNSLGGHLVSLSCVKYKNSKGDIQWAISYGLETIPPRPLQEVFQDIIAKGL